jgi:hypothetical protein
VANDKASLLKQRLRRGSDAFRFDALIEGVSTLEDEAAASSAPIETTAPQEYDPVVMAEVPAVEIVELVEASEELAEQPALILIQPDPTTPDTDSTRLRWALATLTQRFSREVSAFAAALAQRETESAGFHLAQVNQALELLQPLDPAGDLSRGLGVAGAPPPGQPWPAAAWSFVEFSESPLSGLLPSDADEPFLREVLYNAWGIPSTSAP